MIVYGMLFSWLILSVLVLVVALGPLWELKKEQSQEYERIFGNGLWLLSVGSLTFYLVTGGYKRNIRSSRIVETLRPALWLARIQCVIPFAMILVLLLW